MDYKKHTKDRFIEKFSKTYKCKKIGLTELSDENYYELCSIANDEKLVLYEDPIKKKKSKRKIIFYKNILMWCVVSHKKKIIKTIYPVRKKDFNKIHMPVKESTI